MSESDEDVAEDERVGMLAEFEEDIDELVESPHDSVMESAVFLDHLHGRTSTEAQRIAMQVVRAGFNAWKLGNDQLVLSFAGYCLAWGNVQLLKDVVEAGPPAAIDGVATKSQWLDELCCIRGKRCKTSNIFATLLERLGPDSAEMLRYALQLSPGHRGIETPRVDHSLASRFPGNLHYALLHVALNGTIVVEDVLVRARQLQQQPMGGSAIMTQMSEGALACLAVMREFGYPVRLNEHVELDAFPFATACGHGSRHDLVLALLRAYREFSQLDIDAPLSAAHRDVGGSIPLDVAIWAGASGPAAAFIDLGCNLDTAVVCKAYGGDPIRAAHEGGRAETAAAVTAALMRRRIAESATPTCAPGSLPSPRRARRARI